MNKGFYITFLQIGIFELKKEITYIGGNPTIVAFDNTVCELLLENKCILCNCCNNPVKIVKVTHFSYYDKKKLDSELITLGID